MGNLDRSRSLLPASVTLGESTNLSKSQFSCPGSRANASCMACGSLAHGVSYRCCSVTLNECHISFLENKIAGELIEMSCQLTLQTQLEFHTNARVMIMTCPSHTTLLLIFAAQSGIRSLSAIFCLANSYSTRHHSLQEILSSLLSPLVISLIEYMEV